MIFMKNRTLLLLMIALSSCQNQKAVTVAVSDESKLKVFEKMEPEQLMCSNNICITEADLYLERGPMIYSVEDKLYFQKYEMAKTILIQKILEKKLVGTGQTLADYQKKIAGDIKISDEEVIAMLKSLKITEITPNSSQFFELKNRLLGDKIRQHYQKLLKDYAGKKGVSVNLPKKNRKNVPLSFNKLVSYQSSGKDELKVTLVMNPSFIEQRNLLESIESVSNYLGGIGKKIGWYFLPYTDNKDQQSNYEKIFICSIAQDKGKTYKTLLDTAKKFETDKKIFDFLTSRKIKTDKLKSCFESKETAKKIEFMKQIVEKSNLVKVPQVIYNEEVELRIPNMMDLKERVETKLKIQTLIKHDAIKI